MRWALSSAVQANGREGHAQKVKLDQVLPLETNSREGGGRKPREAVREPEVTILSQLAGRVSHDPRCPPENSGTRRPFEG